MSRLLSKPLIQIQENSTFDIQYAVGSGVNSIALGILGIGLTIISDISLLIIVGLGIFVINPIIALSSTVIFGLISVLLHKKMNSRSRRIGQEIADIFTFVFIFLFKFSCVPKKTHADVTILLNLFGREMMKKICFAGIFSLSG